MSCKKLFIKIEKKETQKFIDLLKKSSQGQRFIDNRFEVIHDVNHTFFPLINDEFLPSLKSILENKISISLERKTAKRNKNYRPKSFEGYLKDTLAQKYNKFIPKSYDVIGTILIIEFDQNLDLSDPETTHLKSSIGQSLTRFNKNVRTVYEKKSEIKGDFRLRELSLLSGKDDPKTIHKENNCVFNLNVKSTYFSPRLLYERRRVANSGIRNGELIVDMFAGVGPFSIQIAKRHDVKVYSFDINPDAIDYLEMNISQNQLIGEILPYNIDVNRLLLPISQTGKMLKHKVDRIIMNLPEKAYQFLDVATHLLKPYGGIIHFYDISEKPSPIEKTLAKLKNELIHLKWEIKRVLEKKKVKSFSPKAEIIVIDVLVNRQDII